MDTDFHNIVLDDEKNIETKLIKVGNNIWIGSKSTIIKGVTIGDVSVVASNSLVTKDVPESCIVAGNTARIIKRNIKWGIITYNINFIYSIKDATIKEETWAKQLQQLQQPWDL